MHKKWKYINEAWNKWREDSQIDAVEGIKRIAHAPHIGHYCWIVKYKSVYIILMDMGNGWYAYYGRATWWDVLIARINKIKDKIVYGE